MSWIKLAEHPGDLNFKQNNIAIAEVNEKKICIGKFHDSYFAFAYSCPHASGILADGFIDAMGNVVCPVHHYRYSIQNGRNVSGEGFWLKTWPVEIKDEAVFVDLGDSFF